MTESTPKRKITLYVGEKDYQILKDLADKKKRSLTSQIVFMLGQWFEFHA